MKNYRRILQTSMRILVFVILVFCFCKGDKNVQPVAEVTTPSDTSSSNVQEIMLNNQSKFEENVNSIMELIKEKEEELQKAEQELNQKIAQLELKEAQLTKIENEIRQFRTVTYLILVVGLILIIVGLILIFIKKRSSQNKSITTK